MIPPPALTLPTPSPVFPPKADIGLTGRRTGDRAKAAASQWMQERASLGQSCTVQRALGKQVVG